MRKIKFRAWDKEEKRMISFVELMERNTIMYFLDEYIDVFQEVIDEHDSPRIYMQYTGQNDKEKTDIYEGDILDDDGYLIVVKWRNWHAGFNLIGLNTENLEVIGNIYENPELLEMG